MATTPTPEEIAVDNVVRRIGYCSYLLGMMRADLHRAPAAHRAQFAGVLGDALRALEDVDAKAQASGPEKSGP